MLEWGRGVLFLLLTVAFYYLSKALYRRFPLLPLTPLLLTPALLVAVVLLSHVSYADYMVESHWLLWLLGPATVAFAVPVYQHRQLIRRHWLSLTLGVATSVLVAVSSTVWLARWLNLSDLLQRSLAMRSITTPFAVEATRAVAGQVDLTALFVVLTGLIGMVIGEGLLTCMMISSRLGRGAAMGASAHGAGTARAYQMGPTEGVISSLVMLIAGVMTVLLAPWLGRLFW